MAVFNGQLQLEIWGPSPTQKLWIVVVGCLLPIFRRRYPHSNRWLSCVTNLTAKLQLGTSRNQGFTWTNYPPPFANHCEPRLSNHYIHYWPSPGIAICRHQPIHCQRSAGTNHHGWILQSSTIGQPDPELLATSISFHWPAVHHYSLT